MNTATTTPTKMINIQLARKFKKMNTDALLAKCFKGGLDYEEAFNLATVVCNRSTFIPGLKKMLSKHEAKEQDTLHDYISRNLRYLRASLGLSRKLLAEALGGFEVRDFIRLENKDYEFSSRDLDNLVDLCNYFTIPLDDLIFTDLPVNRPVSPTLLDHLKNEMRGMDFNRRKFDDSLVAYIPPIPGAEKETLRSATKQSFRKLHIRFGGWF